MSSLGVPGISSQYDQYIERLVELAKVRRKPLEERLDKAKLQRTVWTDLNRRLLRLQDSGAKLYGLNNVFGERITTSSNEDVAVLRSRRNVEPIDMQLQVRQIAAADRFSSKPISADLTVDSGLYQFVVGQQAIDVNFSGGTLTEFTQALNDVNTDVLRASIVQSSAREQTLFLESRLIGAENALDFKGAARDLAFKLGIITDQADIAFVVESDTRNARSAGRPFDPREQLLLNAGRTLAVNVETSDDRIQEGALLRLSFENSERQRPNVSYLTAASGQSAQQALAEGRLSPVDPLNVPFDLPVSRPDDNLYLRINERLVPLASLSLNDEQPAGELELSLDEFVGQRIQGFVFNNQDGMRDIIVNKIELELPNVADWVPNNATSRAQDAEFVIDGVQVSRDVNVIEDLIPGQTLELRSASPQTVDLSIKHDVDGVREAIIDFLVHYNWTMAHINVATAMRGNDAVIENTTYFETLEELERAKEILGLMQGDQQLNSLKSRLHMMMISPHAVGDEVEGGAPQQLSLSEMGIMTKGLNQRAATVAERLGYFDIHDEERFNQVLATRWDDVRDLFARDPVVGQFVSGLIADPNGGMRSVIQSFVQAPQGVVTLRTRQIGGEIERHEKALDAFDEDLERRRQQWIRDFAAAENAQNELERIQNQIEGINRSQRR